MPKTVWIINQYASTPETGMGGRHYYLAKELAKQGYKVYLIAASYSHLLHSPIDMDTSVKVQTTEGFAFVWIRVPKYKSAHDKKRIWNWFRFAWSLLRLPEIIADKPEAVFYSSPSLIPYLAAERVANKLKAKLVFEVRDIWPLSLIQLGGYSSNHPFIRLMRWIETRAYKNADALISNLPNAVAHMTDNGASFKKFTWVPNGVDLKEVKEAKPLPEKILASLPKDKFIVGYIGTLGVANGLDCLIDAARIIDDDMVAWVLVGKGKEKLRLQAKCESLGLKNVHFIEAVSKKQVQTMLSLFDVCYIGWKNKPIYQYGVAANKIPEYLYSSKPVIHSFSGARDAVQEANAGLSVPAESPEAIANAVSRIKGMSLKDRQQLGENGRKYALENYDYAMVAKRMMAVIEQIT